MDVMPDKGTRYEGVATRVMTRCTLALLLFSHLSITVAKRLVKKAHKHEPNADK